MTDDCRHEWEEMRREERGEHTVTLLRCTVCGDEQVWLVTRMERIPLDEWPERDGDLHQSITYVQR